MRNFFLKQLQKIVKTLARLTIARFHPTIIGVTGSVGKTSTKEAIYAVLSSVYKTRRNLANLNNEIGLPLTILGNYSNSGGFFFWLGAIIAALIRLLFGGYPKFLVLEYAADRPGDLTYLLEIARPTISVVTAIGDIPVHVEFYENVEMVAREKSRLVETLTSTGTAILNADDERVLAMAAKTRAKIITYGFSEKANVRITNLETHIETINDLARPTGISFKLSYGGIVVPIRLSDTAGKPQAYAAAAAACAGIISKMNFVQIANALAEYKPLSQRMNFLNGIRNSLLVDDSYNASPLSVAAAIETIKSLPAMRKVAILGDMRELGKFSKQAHQTVGKMAREVFDVVVAVGQESKVMDADYWFSDAASALPPIKQLIKEGDLILVKASHSIGLEKIVDALRKE